MNQLLQNRYNELGPDEIFQLKHKLSDSPRLLLLIDLLEKRRDKKINTADAVDFIYKDEKGNFETLRNRFFKLRKQLIEFLSDTGKSPAAKGLVLLPLEEKLYQCRQLIAENHFQLARNELRLLIAECRKLNIFEILPDAFAQMIYCNMAMNVLKDNERLLTEQTDASAVLHDLRLAQAQSRRIYLYVLSRQYTLIPGLLRQMRRLCILRSAYPRFKMLYHFTVVGYTISIPGFSTRAHARHLTSLKKLIEKYPGMPAGYYEPNGTTLMQFYLLTAEGTHLFMRGDVASCYKYFRDSWDIMDRMPNLRIKKAESHFLNRMSIEIATGRYREAIKTSEDLIEFQKDQRQEEKRLKGYAEMANIYTYAFPALKCPNPEFLQGQLKSYVTILKKGDSTNYGDGLCTQAIFHFMCSDFKSAKKIMEHPQAREIFTKMNLSFYNTLLSLSPVSPPQEIAALKKELEQVLHKAISSDRVFSVRRALNLLKLLEKK